MNSCRTFLVYFLFLRNSVRQTHPKILFGVYEFHGYQRKVGRASFTCLNSMIARAHSKAVWHLGSKESLGDVCVLRVCVRHFHVYWCAVKMAFCCCNGCLMSRPKRIENSSMRNNQQVQTQICRCIVLQQAQFATCFGHLSCGEMFLKDVTYSVKTIYRCKNLGF